VLETVMSKTRPRDLPPKARKEDDKHMADWQAMMKLSRAAGKPFLAIFPRLTLRLQPKSAGTRFKTAA
jgi:hypothetical protein